MSAVLEQVAIPDTTPLQATLAMDEGTRARLRQAALVVASANAFEIDCQEMAGLANEELKSVKVRLKQVEEMESDFVAPAKLMLANAIKWFRPSKDALAQAESILKGKLLAWQKSETERVAAENRAREELARRLRLEAEQKAAAERARAAEVERKAKQEAAIAEAAKRKAQEEAEAARRAGDKEAAAKAEREAKAAAAEQAKKEEAERQAKADGERRARETELAAAAAQPLPPVAAPAALKGFGTAQRWETGLDTEKAPTDADAIKMIAAAMGDRPELVAYLKLDWVAIRRTGTAQKQHFNIPGLKCVPFETAVSRKG